MRANQDQFLNELIVRIEQMTPHQKLFKVLHDELTKRGYWHNTVREETQFLNELRVKIQHMNLQSPIYDLLRDELTAKGYWRHKPRGNPKKGWAAMKAKLNG